jgi:hypothetical protein
LKVRHATIVFVVTVLVVVVVVVEEEEVHITFRRLVVLSTSFLAEGGSMDMVVELPFIQLTTRVQFSFSMTAKSSSPPVVATAAQPLPIAQYTNSA